MRSVVAVLCAVAALSLCSQGTEAKPKKKARAAKKAAPAVATKETTVAIERLMGVFKWGMSPEKVLGVLEEEIRREMEPVIKKTADPMKQDRVRREMMDKVKALKQTYVKFEGKPTPWDVSLVDKEFAHKNNETMVVVWGKDDRRFYFFHNDRLWKIYIAFNTEKYDGKTFEDFSQAMEVKFGRAERKLTATLSGQMKLSHLAWPPTGTTLLRAIDNTGFYGNFCLALTDKSELSNVRHGRKINSPKKEYSDPLVEAVTKDSAGKADENEDIVDRITGRETKGPAVSDTAASSPSEAPRRSPGRAPEAAPPAKRQKKINAKNPLDGLDL
jgi:hypothetical protein